MGIVPGGGSVLLYLSSSKFVEAVKKEGDGEVYKIFFFFFFLRGGGAVS